MKEKHASIPRTCIPEMKTLILTCIVLQASPAVAGPIYQNWASGNGLSGVSADPDADPDSDGIPNSVEFVIDGVPTPLLPGSDSSRLLPTATLDPGYLTVVYRRAQYSTEFSSLLQYSTSLLSWQNAVHGMAGVLITVQPGGFGTNQFGFPIDRITVKIPRPSPQGKLFVRLAVNST